ncbi:hypothetical protein O3M35_000523 [Rhynocoris fuscipes]|uniref:Uncharacterized protein n=1 Tax=Rhynocoris fuscipes TaxID=488301 RepID=A0AAW1DMZ2_9HEMI
MKTKMTPDFIVEERDNLDVEQPLTCTSVIDSVLDQITIYQLGRGVPKENYTYMSLMSAMMTMAGGALHAVFSLMLALAPITEIVLHVLRFTLEKASEICRTTNRQELGIKIVIFTMQLLSALFLVTFVFGTILFPVFMMGIAVLSKLLYMATGI